MVGQDLGISWDYAVLVANLQEGGRRESGLAPNGMLHSEQAGPTPSFQVDSLKTRNSEK